jgi:hypothetical protein
MSGRGSGQHLWGLNLGEFDVKCKRQQQDGGL